MDFTTFVKKKNPIPLFHWVLLAYLFCSVFSAKDILHEGYTDMDWWPNHLDKRTKPDFEPKHNVKHAPV